VTAHLVGKVQYRHTLLLLDLSDADLKSLSYTSSPMGARLSTVTPNDAESKVERAPFNKSARSCSGPFDGHLKTLWHKVVKPVLDRLGWKASARSHVNVLNMYTDDQCSHRRTSVHVCTGAPLVCSASSHYMQPVSMTGYARCAAVTLWCHHTPLLSQRFYVRKEQLHPSTEIVFPLRSSLRSCHGPDGPATAVCRTKARTPQELTTT
jgi:hypothetical protein